MNWKRKSRNDWGRLGLRSNDWREVTLGELGEIVGGGTPSTKNETYYGGNIPWITPKDLASFDERYIKAGSRSITSEGLENSSTKMLPKGTVLFSSRAPIGYIAIAKNAVTTNQDFKSIIPNSNIDSLFLYYLLKFNKNKIENMGSGTTFKEVSANVMRRVEVRIPTDIDEQRRIASFLGSIDDKIENNKKINHHLEEISTIIWQEKFSNKIPNGVLGDIAIISSGKRPPVKVTEPTDKETVPILGASSIMGYTNQALYHQKILVTGRVGTHGIIQRYQRSCWPSDNTLVLQSDSYEFVYQVLKNIDFTAMNRGSTQPLITQTDLKKSKIYIPNADELSEFETVVGSHMKRYEQNNIENEVLSALRDTLLPKLLSGEIPVN